MKVTSYSSSTSSSNGRESSCVSLDEVSPEATSFRQFQQVMEMVVALQENKLTPDRILSDKVPEGFSNLVDLQYLNLSSNGFTGRIPSNYGLLQSLIVLSVSFNRVSGMIPSELGSCSNLEVLQLRSNHLRGNILRDISRYLI
ncbi:probable LRR receptor-like serine/threonine-protein kinase At4g36180 [Hibiscus syriacus]|uniref:probable LRR receptor-like serine/threonine-protein kinase At4g36180 n=1 Tax=Hibiscus syriacus TaxID=106335 RepID=UPI0019250F82|nr:probable LRR receptor-like serine/threonine-protein kinase At4g36180 [Hibiscus syriacus]